MKNVNFLQNMVSETLFLSEDMGVFEVKFRIFLKQIPNSRKSSVTPIKNANFNRIYVNDVSIDLPLNFNAFSKLKKEPSYMKIDYFNTSAAEKTFTNVMSSFLKINISPIYLSFKKQKYLLFLTEPEINQLDYLLDFHHLKQAA